MLNERVVVEGGGGVRLKEGVKREGRMIQISVAKKLTTEIKFDIVIIIAY